MAMSCPASGWCEKCGKRARLLVVQTCSQTHWSPAETELWCEGCNEKAREAHEQAEERRGISAEDWERV